jgi:hypothetical protein
VETNQLQRADQIELIVNRASQAELTVSTGGSRGTPVPIAECSERTLALAVVLAPNSLDPGEDCLARADMLRLGAAKILDKRPGPFGDECKCEFEPGWLAADLLEKTQMRRVHMRTYEKNVTRARRVRTLRSGKRTLEIRKDCITPVRRVVCVDMSHGYFPYGGEWICHFDPVSAIQQRRRTERT